MLFVPVEYQPPLDIWYMLEGIQYVYQRIKFIFWIPVILHRGFHCFVNFPHKGFNGLILICLFIGKKNRKVPVMPLASKPKKVKPKGVVRELKIVHTVSRRGADTVKTEEVKTPWHESRKTSSSSQLNQSSSPVKRPKFGGSDAEPIPCYLEGRKQPTLVILFSW